MTSSLSYAIWINHTRREYVVFRGNDTPLIWLVHLAAERWHFAKDAIVVHVRHMFDDYALVPHVGAFVTVDAFWPKMKILLMDQNDAFLYTEHLRGVYEFAPPINNETYFAINQDNTRRLTDAQLSYVDVLKQRTGSPAAPTVSFDEAMSLMVPYMQQQQQHTTVQLL
jgi:hypothetical protein